MTNERSPEQLVKYLDHLAREMRSTLKDDNYVSFRIVRPDALAIEHAAVALRSTHEPPEQRPELSADSPDGQFAAVLKEHERGEPVNAQDLINALHWRVRNQQRELKLKNARIEQLQNDCQELTCGDPRLVIPVHVDATGKTREPPHCPSCDCGMTPVKSGAGDAG